MPDNPHPTKTPSTAPGRGRNSKAERSKVLLEALQHSVREEREGARAQVARQSRARPIAFAIITALAAVIGIYSWVAKPEFIWGPRLPPPAAAARTEAGVRFTMYLLARRAEAYRAREGSFPASAAEIGADTSFVYRRVGDGFSITARVNDRALTLRSDDDFQAFLGNSVNLIQEKVAR